MEISVWVGVGTAAAGIVAGFGTAWAKMRTSADSRPELARPELARIEGKLDGLQEDFTELRTEVWPLVNKHDRQIGVLEERTKHL